MLLALVLGFLKGAVLGGAVGYGAHAAGLGGGFHWITYGVVGVVVGLFVGRTIFSNLRDKDGTAVTSALKAAFGYGVCVGLYALVAKAWGGFELSLMNETRPVYDWQFVMGAAIGGVWGGFLEIDDYDPARKRAAKDAPKAAAKAATKAKAKP